MQLFTHLLSSYLQGMGDFFSALPWEGTEKLPLFPFYRRGQASLSGVYETFWLRCVVRVKIVPEKGLERFQTAFSGTFWLICRFPYGFLTLF